MQIHNDINCIVWGDGESAMYCCRAQIEYSVGVMQYTVVSILLAWAPVSFELKPLVKIQLQGFFDGHFLWPRKLLLIPLKVPDLLCVQIRLCHREWDPFMLSPNRIHCISSSGVWPRHHIVLYFIPTLEFLQRQCTDGIAGFSCCNHQ